MNQAISAFVINLDRRPDRMERIAAHLGDIGVAYHRIPAIDAQNTDPAWLDRVISKSGPLGSLGDGDRACTVSHWQAWGKFLKTSADFALFLEDDAFLARDVLALLTTADWVPEGVDVVKLEKFGQGASNVLLGPPVGSLPVKRELRRLHSRHAGGAAYILSRCAARAGIGAQGSIRVPVDHLWFNPNVSRLARRFPPHVIRPAMATQRAWGYNSDIAALGRKTAPGRSWALWQRKLKRGFFEIRLLPYQLALLAFGRVRLRALRWCEGPRSAGGGSSGGDGR